MLRECKACHQLLVIVHPRCKPPQFLWPFLGMLLFISQDAAVESRKPGASTQTWSASGTASSMPLSHGVVITRLSSELLADGRTRSSRLSAFSLRAHRCSCCPYHRCSLSTNYSGALKLCLRYTYRTATLQSCFMDDYRTVALPASQAQSMEGQDSGQCRVTAE